MINHQMQLYNVNLASPAFVSSDTVQLVVLPLFHTGGMNCYANPVLHAGEIFIRDFDPGLALSILEIPNFRYLIFLQFRPLSIHDESS